MCKQKQSLSRFGRKLALDVGVQVDLTSASIRGAR
jgi:hypothetical protein